jgi:hypothetical protein
MNILGIKTTLIDDIAEAVPKVKRGIVWCKTCGREEKVVNGLQNGWPKCCGYTMTIDSPAEREALTSEG